MVTAAMERLGTTAEPTSPTWGLARHRYVLDISHRCAHGCIYCFAEASPRGVVLGASEALRLSTLVAEAESSSTEAVTVGFFGHGEPTTAWPALQLIVGALRESLDGRVRFHLTTNGWLSTKHTNWIRDNIDGVTVSLDGPSTVHNAQRPGPARGRSHARTKRSIMAMQPRVQEISCTIVEGTAERVSRLLDYFEADFEHLEVRLQPCERVGRYATRTFTLEADAFLDDRLLRHRPLRNVYAIGDLRSQPRADSWLEVQANLSLSSGAQAFVTPILIDGQLTHVPLGQLKRTGIEVDSRAVALLDRLGGALRSHCKGCICHGYCRYDRPDLQVSGATAGSIVDLRPDVCDAYRRYVRAKASACG